MNCYLLRNVFREITGQMPYPCCHLNTAGVRSIIVRLWLANNAGPDMEPGSGMRGSVVVTSFINVRRGAVAPGLSAVCEVGQ